MSKGQCFSGLTDALEELHTDTYLSLHRICIFCISFAACYSGSGLTSLCMHVYLFASVLFCMQLLL